MGLKRTILSIFVLAVSCFAQQAPMESQARLDALSAANWQYRIVLMQRQLDQGRITRQVFQKNAKETADYHAVRRRKYVNTKYLAIYDAVYQQELNDLVSGRKVQFPRPPTPPPGPPRPDLGSRILNAIWRLIQLGIVFWIVRKILSWLKRLAPKSKPKPAPAKSEYQFVKLTEEEQGRLDDAQRKFDARLLQLKNQLTALTNRRTEAMREAAGLSARIGAMSNALRTACVTELNEDAPEYLAFLDKVCRDWPAAAAPWSHEQWTAFALAPEEAFLGYVRYGYIEESGRLPGETGVWRYMLAPLFAGSSMILVACDDACRPNARAIIQNIVLRAAIASPAEIRFSLIDPMGLGAAFPMRSLLPRVRRSSRTPADELAEIVDDIRRINEAVVGQEERFSSLPSEKRAGEVFEVIVALDYPAAYERDPRALEYLARIAQSGTRAGRHLILEYYSSDKKDTAPIKRFETPAPRMIDLRPITSDWYHVDAVAPAELQKKLLTAITATKARSTGGDWNVQVRPKKLFSESSARIVETPVGERLRFWFGDEQDGKPSAHAMLAGQTGSGKSFLLHVLITGLAARYAPSELRLILVDGKQGVEFEAYKTLPHAQVVCLRTSPAIARSVLEDFVAEMEDRYVKFQREGVTKLEDYRRKTGQTMPRMLMIVDEYQQLLDGDPERGAQMLSRVLEKGRAAGAHLVLGSQTFEVRGLPSAAMTHVHLRSALSLPVDYVQAISAFGPEGKKLIRELAPSGQVVINDESGRDGANARGAVARLDPASGAGLGKIVEEIRTAAGPSAAAIVLTGNDAAVLADNPFVQRWRAQPPSATELQDTARKTVRDGGFGVGAWSAADRPLPLWLGRRFDVRGHLVAALRRAPGHNLLALGAQTSTRLCMLANALAGLRSMQSMRDAQILLLDGLGDGQPGAGILAAGLDILSGAGARVDRVARDGAAPALEQFATAALHPADPSAPRLLILSEPEYFPDLASAGGFGSPTAGPSKIFKDILRNGPPLGAHAIVTAASLGTLSTVVHPSREAALFNHRAVQQSNEEESMTLFSSLHGTRIMEQTDHQMAAMYVDSLLGVRANQLFKSYGANADIYGDQTAAGLTAALRSLYRL